MSRRAAAAFSQCLLACWLISPVSGQQLVGMEVVQLNCEGFSAMVSAFFPFGYGSTCPQLSGSTLSQSGSIAVLDLYYNTSGPWPQVGCTTASPIAAVLPFGTSALWLRLRNVMDGDTSEVVSDTTLATCSLSVDEVQERNASAFILDLDHVRWRPEAFPADMTLVLLSSSGARITSVPVREGALPVQELGAGVYFVHCPLLPQLPAWRFVIGGS